MVYDRPFCIILSDVVWKKILNLRSEMGRQMKKNNKPSGASGGGAREWRFLRSLSFLRCVILPRKTTSNLNITQESKV